ncbi:uncharacterized protein [Argopecten irradians]|uniref:uncharacterized protein n=1 Tax=Argopecten irradians TaxID=31199 RepID=UPI00372076B5
MFWSNPEQYQESHFQSELQLLHQMEEIEFNCSYRELMDLVQEKSFHSVYRGYLIMLNKEISSDILREFCTTACRSIGEEILSVPIITDRCPNKWEIRDILQVLGGICTHDGEITPFLDQLLSGFVTTSKVLQHACLKERRRIYRNCSDSFKNIEWKEDLIADSKVYKRIMKEFERCTFEQYEDVDKNICGATESLKKVNLILKLFFYMGPGVTFDMSDFEFSDSNSVFWNLI